MNIKTPQSELRRGWFFVGMMLQFVLTNFSRLMGWNQMILGKYEAPYTVAVFIATAVWAITLLVNGRKS